MRGATWYSRWHCARDWISIHAPHEGCDQNQRNDTYDNYVFQSTHPMRGATATGKVTAGLTQFQSTHPMRGAT